MSWSCHGLWNNPHITGDCIWSLKDIQQTARAPFFIAKLCCQITAFCFNLNTLGKDSISHQTGKPENHRLQKHRTSKVLLVANMFEGSKNYEVCKNNSYLLKDLSFSYLVLKRSFLFKLEQHFESTFLPKSHKMNEILPFGGRSIFKRFVLLVAFPDCECQEQQYQLLNRR